MIRAGLLLVLLVVPGVAHAAGQLAPAQATADIEAACLGPSDNVYLAVSPFAGYELAGGQCFVPEAARFVFVTWLHQLGTGHRWVTRQGLDSAWVPATAPLLVCLVLGGGFEVCR